MSKMLFRNLGKMGRWIYMNISPLTPQNKPLDVKPFTSVVIFLMIRNCMIRNCRKISADRSKCFIAGFVCRLRLYGGFIRWQQQKKDTEEFIF